MAELTDLWVGVQNWLFETFVGPVIFWLGQMAWYEPAYSAVEFVMLGVVQIVVIALGMRFFERRWPLEKAGDDRLIGVDRVYTVLNKLGIVPFAIFVITYPISQEIELLMRSWGMAPPRLERLLPWLGDNVLASFLVYFVLYDFAAYWLHRAQLPWWWALHSLHHSQRRMTVWSDDRNHVLDDFLMTLALVLFSQMVGVQPGEYVSILMVGRLIESWSHANVDMSFGKIGERLIVGPRFHRLHHALANPDERHIHDHNSRRCSRSGTSCSARRSMTASTVRRGRRSRVDADNGRGWIVQQVTVFGRFLQAVTPPLRAPVQPGLRPPAE